MVAHELNGVFTMVSYASVIFSKAGSSLSPGMSSIIVAAIQMLGAYVSSLLIERLGRKVRNGFIFCFKLFQMNFLVFIFSTVSRF